MNEPLHAGLGQAPPAVDDCWNRIGEAGDGSCVRLEQHVRCRNCPVYAQASRALLDRMTVSAVSASQASRTPSLTPSVPSLVATGGSAQAGTVQVIVFRVHGEWLALPVSALEEVAPQRPIHGIPHRRTGSLQGLVNVRGTLLPCVSLAAVLHIASDGAPASGRARMLVVGAPSGSIVVAVDEVDGIYPIDVAQLADIPATLALYAVKHAVGWGTCGRRQVGLLDVGALRSALEKGMQ